MGRVKMFLLPTLPDMANVYDNIYFCLKKNTHTNNKNSTSKFIRTNLRFSYLHTIKDRALCFSTKKSVIRAVFKCKLCFKKSIELNKKNFAAARVKIFCVTRVSVNKSISFLASSSKAMADSEKKRIR